MSKNCIITIAAISLQILTPLAAQAQVSPGGAFKIPTEKQDQPTETRAALTGGRVPIMPSRANTSGYCCSLVDIGIDGKPKKIKIEYCSAKVFKKPTKRSTKGYVFNPAVKNGEPIAIQGQPMITSYHLVDEEGRYIPDVAHRTLVDGKPDFDVNRLCNAVPIS